MNDLVVSGTFWVARESMSSTFHHLMSEKILILDPNCGRLVTVLLSNGTISTWDRGFIRRHFRYECG